MHDTNYYIVVSINKICMYMSMIARHFVMRLTDGFRRAKGYLGPTKWKYLDNMISKRDLVCEWIIIYYVWLLVYYHYVWEDAGFQENPTTQIGYSMKTPEYNSRNVVTMSMQT